MHNTPVPALGEFIQSQPREEAEAEVSGKRRVKGEKRKRGSGERERGMEIGSYKAIVMWGGHCVGP